MSENQTSVKKRGTITWMIGAGALIFIAIAVILITQQGNPSGSATGTFTLTISIDNGAQALFNEKLDIKPEQSLLAIMRENNVELEETDGLITSLCGVSQDQDAGKYWTYTIDGEFAMVGAGEYLPKDGEVIVFDLHAFEG